MGARPRRSRSSRAGSVADLVQDPAHRELVGPARLELVAPPLPPLREFRTVFGPIDPPGPAAVLERCEQLAEPGPRVAYRPDDRVVVLADLGRIDVEVDDLRAGHRERLALYVEELVCSAKRVPTASSTSASLVMWLPTAVPFDPVCSADNGWSSGNTPLPIIVATTGASRNSARARSSAAASAVRHPPPARITGRPRPAALPPPRRPRRRPAVDDRGPAGAAPAPGPPGPCARLEHPWAARCAPAPACPTERC